MLPPPFYDSMEEYMSEKEKLSNKTPKWFEAWHLKHFMPVSDRTRRNEKWIYIIIAAIIASRILGNGYEREIVGFIRSIITAMS